MAKEGQRVRLWDAPVRVVHWSFAILIPALWWTWKTDRMSLHETLGILLLALLLFRLFWGFAGSGPARFTNFVRGPRGVFAYLTGKRREPVLGHNPLGGWSVLALLGLTTAEVLLGLFTQDVDGIESGPLTHLVSYDLAEAARRWHGLAFDALVVLVCVHLAAILFYLLVKRNDLVGPMVTGRKRVAVDAEQPSFAPFWRLAAGAAAAAALAYWVSRGLPL